MNKTSSFRQLPNIGVVLTEPVKTEHLRGDGVEQHPRGPADLLLRQGRHLRILLLRIHPNTLRLAPPYGETARKRRERACLKDLRRRGRGRGRRRGEGEGEEGAEAVVVGCGVGGDEEAAGEGGDGLEHGLQRVRA